MQYKVCKCFSIQGQDYEPEGTSNADALTVFEGSSNHAATLLASGYICEDQTMPGYVSDPEKDLPDNEPCKVCVKEVKLNTENDKYELLDEDGQVVGDSWPHSSPSVTAVLKEGGNSLIITDPDNQDFEVPTQLFDGKDGDPLDKGARVRLMDLNDLDRPARGPVQDITCVNGQEIITYCNGSSFCKRWDYVELRANVGDGPQGPFTGDGGFVEDDIITGTQESITAPNWPCPQKIKLTWIHSLVGHNNFFGSVDTRPVWRVNGGPWMENFDGGIDTLELRNVASDENASRIGEFEFRNDFDSDPLDGGDVIDFAIRYEGSTDVSGVWDLNRTDYKIGYWRCVMDPYDPTPPVVEEP